MKYKPITLSDIIMIKYPDEEFLIANGFDDAVIGVEPASMRLIHSVYKIMKILEEKMESADQLEIMEYIEYNIVGSYVGEKTPIWCYDI